MHFLKTCFQYITFGIFEVNVYHFLNMNILWLKDSNEVLASI